MRSAGPADDNRPLAQGLLAAGVLVGAMGLTGSGAPGVVHLLPLLLVWPVAALARTPRLRAVAALLGLVVPGLLVAVVASDAIPVIGGASVLAGAALAALGDRDAEGAGGPGGDEG